MEWWWLALVVPAYFLQTLVHEASHAVAVKVYGGKVLSFSCWPQIRDRVLFFGRVRFVAPGLTEEQLAAIAWAPFISGLLLWACYFAADLLGAPPALRVFWAAVVVDRVLGFMQPWWRREIGDFNTSAELVGLSRGWRMALGLLFSAGLVTGFVYRQMA